MPLSTDILDFTLRLGTDTAMLNGQSGGLDEKVLAFAERFQPEKKEAPSRMMPAWEQEESWRKYEQEATMAQATKELGESILPSVKAYAIETGADIVSPIARLFGKGEYADRMNRFAEAVEQVQRQKEKGGIVPDILQSGLRGAGRSLTTMYAAGMVGGPYAAIGTAAGQETNRAITTGRDAGLKGGDLAGYAVTQGVIEGLPATVMQRLGLGGVESAVAGKKSIVAVGLKEGLKKLGITVGQELPEELVTEIGHNVAAAVAEVDSDALSPESLRQTVAETTVQTLIAAGIGSAPDLVRSVKAGREVAIANEIIAAADANETPSRKQWKQWKLPAKKDGTIPPSKVRQEAVQAIAADLRAREQARLEAEAGPAPEQAPETPVAEPTAAVQEDLAPGPVETPVAPEAAQEAPGVPVEEVEANEKVIALNKVETDKIRQYIHRPELTEEEVQHRDIVMDEVATSRGDERAMEIAQEALKTGKMLTTHESAALLLKEGKLLNELDAAWEEQAKAAAAENQEAFDKATARIEGAWTVGAEGIHKTPGIIDHLDMITTAARYSRRETARALGFGRLRMNREDFSIVKILNRMQAAKGPKGGELTQTERKLAARLAKEHAELVKVREQLEEAERIADEARDKALAEKVLNAYKPRKEIGRKIREKADKEIADIKDQIRQIGLRVNDITGVTAEGTYLIGRLGIAYIKKGTGSLVEVIENLRQDLPDLNLSDHDVYQALISRNPKAKAQARSHAQKQVAKFQSLARMHVEIDQMAQGVAEKTQKRQPVDPEIKALGKKLTKLRMEYYKTEMDEAKVVRAIERLNILQDQLVNGRTKLKRAPREIPPELADIQDQIRQVSMEIRADEELAKLNEQLRTGEYLPPRRQVRKLVNRQLERKQIEIAKKRQEILQAIEDTAPWTTGKVLKEFVFSAKSVKATADVSFTMRQCFVQVVNHPIKAMQAFGPSLQAFFSEHSAFEINNIILNSQNAVLYEQSGLVIMDAGSLDARQRSEIFRARFVERMKIFGKQNPFGWLMSASSRHATAFSNLMRASAFDQFIANHPYTTQEEMRAFADYVNVSTGLGHLGRFGAVSDYLQVAFFSPKFAVSRIETPWTIVRYWKVPRVRNQIAKDMAKTASTGMMVLFLAYLAGADVEFLDPEDPDWGKIRSGNMRVDIWGGFQQPMRLITKLATGAFIKDFDPLEIIGRFAAFKLSPAVTIPIELVAGETAVGEKTTRLETLGRSVVPLVLEDTAEAWKEEGAVAGVAAGGLAALGVGVSAYKDTETATRKEAQKLWRRGERAKATRLVGNWNRENRENRITMQSVRAPKK